MPYLKVYSQLTAQEQRQLRYKRLFKQHHPQWEDTLALATTLCAAHLKPQAKVLDFGCGNGNWVIDELRERILLAVGIDVEAKATEKNRCLDEVHIGSLTDSRFSEAQFDAVVSLWVLEHLPQPGMIFEQIYRVLKPGGIFLFVTPNRHCFHIWIRQGFNVINSKWGDRLIHRAYGRKEQDIFPTFYRANDIAAIKHLAHFHHFTIVDLRYNFDPSYTAFNRLTYQVTRLMYSTSWNWCKPHLIGLLQKA